MDLFEPASGDEPNRAIGQPATTHRPTSAPFDAAIYAKARPLFVAAIAGLNDFDADPRESMRTVVGMVSEKIGSEVSDKMQPYVERFLAEFHGRDAPQSASRDDDSGDLEPTGAATNWLVRAACEAETSLAALVDNAEVERHSPEFAYGVKECHMCRCDLQARWLFVDGSLEGHGGWANMCAQCFERLGTGIGWGKGQLYARQLDGTWRLVAGFR